MKYFWRFKVKSDTSSLGSGVGFAALRSISVVTMLMGVALLTLAVNTHSRKTVKPVSVLTTSPALPTSQSTKNARESLHRKLYFQPEANKMRLRLGQRFVTSGREIAALTGALTLGNERQIVHIIRSQTDDGEEVAIGLGTEPVSLSWSAVQGPLAAGSVPSDAQRSIIERIALDSPDQFVLAQLRASYYTLARRVMPEEAKGSDDYAGPVWDVVRVGEPANSTQSRVQSLWRLFYINSTTGLLERVVSQEQGATVTAEISGWVDQGGERGPTHITWSRDGRVIMDLLLTGIVYTKHQ